MPLSDQREERARQHKETGAEELRRIVSALGYSQESAVDPFTAEEVICIVRACWSSPWDLLPDMLTDRERKYTAKHGKLSVSCVKRLDREMS